MSGILVTKKKETTLDKIRKYYLKGEDSVRLSDKQQEIRIRILKAWNLLINYHSTEQAMSRLMTDLACSRAQAYRYVSDSKVVFGNPVANHKEAKRYILEEDLKRLQQRAIKDKDGRLELAVIKQLIKLGNFDKDTDPKFDPEKLKAQVYILKPDPAVDATIRQMSDSGVIDFNNLNTEDVDFEDLAETDPGDDYENQNE